MRKYDTVIWDLDGTLLNTLEDLKNSVNYSMRTLGYPERTLEEIRCFVGNGVRRLIALSIPNGVENPDYEKAYELFGEHYVIHNLDNTKPYDGVVDMIAKLKEMGIKQAIVSNKDDFAVKRLNEVFFGVHVAIGVRDNVPRKPSNDMVRIAMNELSADQSRTVYIGDSEVDMLTAKNSGLPCISVSWGFRSHSELEEHNPQVIVDTPSQLIEMLI